MWCDKSAQRPNQLEIWSRIHKFKIRAIELAATVISCNNKFQPHLTLKPG